MQVAFIIDSLAPGGAERSLAELTPRLIERGVEVRFMLLHDRAGLAGEIEQAGATVEVLAGANRRSWIGAATSRLRQLEPDLVHTTLFDADIVGRTAARLAGVPVVSNLVNTPYGPEHLGEFNGLRLKARAAQASDFVTARFVRRFRAVSGAVKDAYVQRLRIRPDLVDVIPEGRDPARLGRRTPERRSAARALLGVEDAPVVLAVGRQEPQKGFDVLLRAVPALTAALPGTQVLIAGRDGRATSGLAAICEGLGQEVRMLGHRNDVADLLCAADVFVLPSRREGIPGVVQEAMALETPIVASDIRPVREAVGTPPSAELVPVGDAAALATAVRGVLSDPASAAKRAIRGRERFETEFDIACIADRMIDFYEKALRVRARTGK